eukprot:TRINITY_DN7159_c0_g2_i2.p1 TRINITY_DN7159_c0_g2~~TRINITY_DN7159_c0_g2_i2.p1  ORF type:complete len:466 (-),score=51.88 TRINITY_DN7159_c0_g2_i2:356-1672(-)
MGCASSISHGHGRSFHSCYVLKSTLGHGAFGQVRLAYKKDTLDEVAVKITILGDNNREHHRRACRNEALLALRMGSHPNCVQLFESIEEQAAHYMIMERCQCSLLDAIKQDDSLIQHDLQRICGEMLTGIAHCRSLRVVHRDVKPENFMLGGPEGTTLKLCDFGVAKALPNEGYVTGTCGTAPYMAPEVVREEPYDDKVDVWSFGVVVYVLLFKRFPYVPKLADSTAMKAAISIGVPGPLFSSDEKGDFARMLLNRSKKHRCSASKALSFAFLKPRTSLPQQTCAETSFAALLDGAADTDVRVGLKASAQHRLDETLDRLQQKHGGRSARRPASSSSTPTFYNVSEAPEDVLHVDAKSYAKESSIRSCTRPKTHTGFLNSVFDHFDRKVTPGSCMSQGSTVDRSFDDISLTRTLDINSVGSFFSGASESHSRQASKIS